MGARVANGWDLLNALKAMEKSDPDALREAVAVRILTEHDRDPRFSVVTAARKSNRRDESFLGSVVLEADPL